MFIYILRHKYSLPRVHEFSKLYFHFVIMSLSKWLALDKVTNLFRIIRDNGGIRASLWKMYKTDDLKSGELVGEDEFGNKYYQNPRYFYGTNRWVIYHDNFHMNYDASQVSAEWYGWLHYKTDLPPHQDPSRPKYPWMAKFTENLSGTAGQWTPYSTTTPKIEPWVPNQKSSA